MTAVEAWAIVDKDGNLVDVRKKRLSYVADAKLRVRVWRLDVEHPSRAPHTAVKGEWRPTMTWRVDDGDCQHKRNHNGHNA